MYRDAPRHHVQAPKPLHPLVEKLYLAAFFVASPVLAVLSAWRQIYALMLRSLAPQPLCGPELDALFTRLTTDLPARLVSYPDYVSWNGCEEDSCLVVLTFRNGDVVSFDASASGGHARLRAAVGNAKFQEIQEHRICGPCLGMAFVVGLFATLIESIVLAFFSKVIALLFAATFVVTWFALIAAHSITAPKR